MRVRLKTEHLTATILPPSRGGGSRSNRTN
jgi:hypothetical protein